MNGSSSVRVALFTRNGGSESPCRWFYVTEIYILTNIYARNILFTIHIDTESDINRTLYNTTFTANVIVDSIHKYYGIYLFERAFLLLSVSLLQ